MCHQKYKLGSKKRAKYYIQIPSGFHRMTLNHEKNDFKGINLELRNKNYRSPKMLQKLKKN